MIIRKNRILSLNKYLGHIKSDTKIYISVPANSDNKEILNEKCGVLTYEVGRKITPCKVYNKNVGKIRNKNVV